MKVKCIDRGFWLLLTIGKTYDVIDVTGNWYLIINDNGDKDWYYKSSFKPLSEIRNEKIDKLLE
jgi:hypothetical protein